MKKSELTIATMALMQLKGYAAHHMYSHEVDELAAPLEKILDKLYAERNKA